MTKGAIELIVGAAFLFAISVLGFYTIMISGISLGATKKYLVEFDQVYGLKVGDAVRVEGHEKGEVTSIRLDPVDGQGILAVLKVDAEVEIYREGSEVRVTPFSPLGGRVVEIKRGVKDSPLGKYTPFHDEDELANLPREELERKFLIKGEAEGELLQTLNQLVEENRENVKEIIANLSSVSNQLTKTDNVLGYLFNDQEGGQKIRGVADGLSSSAQRLDRILARVEAGEGVVGGLLQDKSQLHQDFQGAISAGKDSLENLSSILDRADQGKSALGVFVAEDPATTADVRGIVRDVKVVTGEIAGGRGTLGKLVQDDRLYEGAATTAGNFASISKKIDEGKGLLGVLLEKQAGEHTRETLEHMASITRAIDDPEAGTIGMLVHDDALRGRIDRIAQDVERLVVEFRDSVEDVREQAPVSAFIGTVFAAF